MTFGFPVDGLATDLVRSSRGYRRWLPRLSDGVLISTPVYEWFDPTDPFPSEHGSWGSPQYSGPERPVVPYSAVYGDRPQWLTGVNTEDNPACRAYGPCNLTADEVLTVSNLGFVGSFNVRFSPSRGAWYGSGVTTLCDSSLTYGFMRVNLAGDGYDLAVQCSPGPPLWDSDTLTLCKGPLNPFSCEAVDTGWVFVGSFP